MRRRGFTYIELGAVLAIMTLLAGLVVPNVVRMDQINRDHAFRTKLIALAGLARSKAIESGETVALGYDKSETTLQAIMEPAVGNAVKLDNLKLPDGVTATKFSSDKDESPPDGWRLPFFVDGTSSGGGIEFDIDGRTYSLVVPKGASYSELKEGPLPDLSFDQWPAGSYERRQ